VLLVLLLVVQLLERLLLPRELAVVGLTVETHVPSRRRLPLAEHLATRARRSSTRRLRAR
jgi:hypothetical protein